MPGTFSNVLIFSHPRSKQHSVRSCIDVLLNLLKDYSILPIFEADTAKLLNITAHQICKISEAWDQIDLIISVGGDGTFLQAGRKAAQHQIPIIGINRGRLGFLTDLCPNTLQKKLPPVLEGAYHEEKRFLLEAKQKHCLLERALNDIVFFTGDHLCMINLDIIVNQEPMFRLRGDGLIISTPTGSTAYSLSAGGSILHPTLSAINLIPMYPHTLSNRPIVLDSRSILDIRIGENNLTCPRLSADGQAHHHLGSDSVVTVTAAPDPLRLLHPLDYNYFQTLGSKLNWQLCHDAHHLDPYT